MSKVVVSALILAGLAVTNADGNESSPAPEFATPEDSPITTSDSSTIHLTLGGVNYDYPVTACKMMQGFAMVQGEDGDSGIAVQSDAASVAASFQHHFDEGGQHYWDQWDAKRGMDYFYDGEAISASGTMKRISRRQRDSDGNWQRLQDVERRSEPFTITATCSQ